MNTTICSLETVGKITNLKIKGQDFPTVITVSYTVDSEVYSITESVKLKSEKIKIGFLPIGQKRVPILGSTRVGSTVRVKYNPQNPQEAFLPDNVGKANV